MTVGRFAKHLQYSMIGVLVLVSFCPSRALAQDAHSHMLAPQHQESTPEQKSRENALVQAVRKATERFQDSQAAEGEEYFLTFGCVSGDDFGAMGLHFINMSLVGTARLTSRSRRSFCTSRCPTDACG